MKIKLEEVTTISEIINRIKDPKLRQLLNVYKDLKDPITLLAILNHLNVNVSLNAIGALIPQFDYEEDRIWLGGLILQGTPFKLRVDVYEDGDILIDLYQTSNIVLYFQRKNG